MPPLKGIKVQLDEERYIRYTNWTLARLERDTGKSFVQHIREMENNASHYAMVSLTWAGLIHSEPKLTLEEAAERIDLSNAQMIMELGKAIGDSYKQLWGEKPEEAPKAAADASASSP